MNSSTEFRTGGLVALKLSYFIKVLQQSLQMHFKFFDTKKLNATEFEIVEYVDDFSLS